MRQLTEPKSVQHLPVTPHECTRVAGARVEGKVKENYIPLGAYFACPVPRVARDAQVLLVTVLELLTPGTSASSASAVPRHHVLQASASSHLPHLQRPA